MHSLSSHSGRDQTSGELEFAHRISPRDFREATSLSRRLIFRDPGPTSQHTTDPGRARSHQNYCVSHVQCFLRLYRLPSFPKRISLVIYVKPVAYILIELCATAACTPLLVQHNPPTHQPLSWFFSTALPLCHLMSSRSLTCLVLRR